MDVYNICTCVALSIKQPREYLSTQNEAKVFFNRFYVKFMQFEIGLLLAIQKEKQLRNQETFNGTAAGTSGLLFYSNRDCDRQIVIMADSAD